MGRAKQTMELISNEKTRLITFQKRKNGLLKKARELKILCDVPVCVIIYGPQPYHRPEVRPENPDEIKPFLDLYRGQSTEDKARRTVDVSNFFEERKQKIEDEINKLRKKNEEARYTKWDPRYDDLSKEQLFQLEHELANKITDLKDKVERLRLSAAQPMVRLYYPSPPAHEVYGNNYRNNYLAYDNVGTVMNPPNTMMAVNDNYQNQHLQQQYFMYNQQLMDQALVSYDQNLMMMGQKNLSHLNNNNLGNHGQQMNGLDSQQVLAQWQYTQPQMGLPQMGLTHFYPTNPSQYDRSM